MEHEIFRYLSPGICFVTPIYLAACWAVINSARGEPLKEFILIGGSATVPALAIPFGWYIYNCFRAFRHVTTTAYESKPFIRIIRDALRVVPDPARGRYFIDFSCINQGIGWRSFSRSDFFTVFYPFKKGRRARLRELRRGRCVLGYLEPVSDLILFPNPTYDYARSISSVRYGIDSSIFASAFGTVIGLAALGILSHSVDDPPFQVFARVPLYFWWALFSGLLSLLGALSFLRRKQAACEYSSRLTLITTISSDATRARRDSLDHHLPADLRELLERLPAGGDRYAAFDMDNTLLVGDIGEAVFAELLRAGALPGASWRAYQRQLAEDREAAYVSVVEAMRGLPVELIVETTERLISGAEKSIEVEGERVPVPRPHPLMQSLVVSLRLRGVEVYVITASNQIAAETAAWSLFGIPSDCVLGIRSHVRREASGRRVLGSVAPPVTYAEGKVKALQGKRGIDRPCLTAGDSQQDIPLLRYTHDDGLVLWVGDSPDALTELRQSALDGRRSYFVIREGGAEG